jgi:hypothetical protein
MVNNLTSYVNTNYYTGEGCDPGVEYQETIVALKERLFDGDTEATAILCFESGRQLPLNQTNLKTLIRAYGPHPDNLIGQKIILYREMVPFGGRMVPGVRIHCVVAGARPAVAAEARKAIGSATTKPNIGLGKARWDAEGPPDPTPFDDVPFPTEDDYQGGDSDNSDSIPF